jgi:TldD protein
MTEHPPFDQLRALALAAMDAARSAGADFADIRLGVQRRVIVSAFRSPMIEYTVGYGIRAAVRDTWSFQHGELLTLDAIAAAARSAVTGARTYAGVNAQLASVSKRPPASAWASTPVVTGEWHVPVEVDPFTVPIDEYRRVLGALTDTTAHVTKNASVGAIALRWDAETRIFASTAGSLVTQTSMYGGPDLSGGASLPDDRWDKVGLDVASPSMIVGGFETAFRPAWIAQYMAGLDDAIRLRELPRRAFADVGRFPIVFAGSAFGRLFGNTVNLAVDAERAAGLERSASGTTYLVPIDDVMRAREPQFSPLLTATSGRALPSTAAIGWDDEGVVPEPYTILDRGHVVDYHTTRETAPLLTDWYAARGRTVRAHGTTVATSPTNVPIGGTGHVTVAPASQRATVEELSRGMTHGFVVRDSGVTADMGLTGGVIAGGALEIRNGTPVARVDLLVQFVTSRVLHKQLDALGDASTVRTVYNTVTKGIPWQGCAQPISAPAALIKDVDVITWDLSA